MRNGFGRQTRRRRHRAAPDVLPFVAITSEEADVQLKREFAVVQKDSGAMKRNKQKVKQKRIDEKRALAARRQKDCRDRKKKTDIQLGLRDALGKRVKKTVNESVCHSI